MNKTGLLSNCRFDLVGPERSPSVCISNKLPGVLVLLVPDRILNKKNLESESLEGSDLYSIHPGICGI